MKSAAGRLSQINALMGQINATADQKAVQEIQARIGAENPRSIRRGQQIFTGARGAGFFHKDANGDPVGGNACGYTEIERYWSTCVSAAAVPPVSGIRHIGPPDPPPQLPSTMSP